MCVIFFHLTFRHGYPDPGYFVRVTQELADKGITSDLVADKEIKSFICIRNGQVVHRDLTRSLFSSFFF